MQEWDYDVQRVMGLNPVGHSDYYILSHARAMMNVKSPHFNTELNIYHGGTALEGRGRWELDADGRGGGRKRRVRSFRIHELLEHSVLSIMHCALQQSAAIFLMLKNPLGLIALCNPFASAMSVFKRLFMYLIF